MRVIAGEFRSRRLKSIPGPATRPTPDRLRETLFNILAPRIEGAAFVDAYAGTGAVGIEALSRGARHAWFLERSRAALEVLRENLAALSIESRATVVPGAVQLTLPRQRGDIVFLDPPYEKEREYALALNALAAAPPPLVIVQHSVRFELEDKYGTGVGGSASGVGEVDGSLRSPGGGGFTALTRTRQVRQGDNVLSFFARVPK